MGGDRADEEPTDADLEPSDHPDPEMPGSPVDNGDAAEPDPTGVSTPDDGRTESPPIEGTEDGADSDETPADGPPFEGEKGTKNPMGFDYLNEHLDEKSTADDGEESAAGDAPVDGPETIEDIDGIGAAKANALRDAGYETVDDVRAATADGLTDADGIGDALAARIKAAVGEIDLVEEEETVPDDADGDDETPTSADARAVEDDEPLLSGPQSDEEMPLTAHIEEMVKRLAIVVAIAGVVSLVTFPFSERIINFLWYNIMPGVPGDIARPRLYGVLELVFTKLKVASLAGLIVALPALVYETYQFMRPGLYAHERRYYLAAVPASLVLALVGVSFAYFIVLPAIFTYFLAYSQDVATIGFALGRTFNLILVLMGYLALVFQIPLFIMLSMMMGLVTRRWLANRRLLFWGAFLGVSFLFSPDPTGMAPVIIALTMVGLFEGTLLMTKWAGRE